MGFWGFGFLGTGGCYFAGTSQTTPSVPPTSGLSPVFSIDFIGTGGGGVNTMAGVNGGGGGGSTTTNTGMGGFPGGGGGAQTGGAAGLVIVEW